MCNQASEPGEAQAALAARNLGMTHSNLDISISCKGQANTTLGITTNFAKRMADHKSNGWILIEHVGTFDGKEVQETESSLKKWLETKIGLIDRSTENWLSSKIEFRSLRGLFEYSGINPLREGKDGEVDT